jgi:DNA-binding XRE family transcriptional regulator
MFRGRVYKGKKFWLIEVPDLDLMTQGYTKEDAYFMLDDALKSLLDMPKLKLDIARHRNNTFLLDARDEESEKALIALMLQRLRRKAGLTLSQMAKLLGARSKNTYARYEHGTSVPSHLMLRRIFRAMGLGYEMRVHPKEDDEELTVF